MAYIIKMPKLGMGMNQGLVLEWFIGVDDHVNEGDPILEIESEKTTAEIAATEDGILRRAYVKEGVSVDPGTSLGIVSEPDDDIGHLEADIDREVVHPSSSGTPLATEQTSSPETEPEGSEDSSNRLEGVRASPRAKRGAQKLEVDLGTVQGSGPQGAITLSDVEAAAEKQAAETPLETQPPGAREVKATPKAKKRARELDVDLMSVEGSGPQNAVTSVDVEASENGVRSKEASSFSPTVKTVESRELSSMRRTIADRLGKSYREAVHVTVHREIELEETMAAIEVADGYVEDSVSLNDIVLLAVSKTLSEHPKFNATFEDGTHRIHESQDIGIAIDIEEGLVTPIIQDVGERSLTELVSGRHKASELALSGEFTGEDISGGTFTVSNLGVFGVDSFTPIINPPQIGILGIDRVKNQPIERDGELTFVPHGGFDLSFDHRIVDGADAARFLDTFATHLKNPWPLLLERA